MKKKKKKKSEEELNYRIGKTINIIKKLKKKEK
jgi:hypothetical protein